MLISNELIQACKRRERVAQKQLYAILVPYLNPVCRRYLYNSSDAKDALQESFINIFSNIDQYDSNRGLFKTWAIKITINCTLKLNAKMYKMPVNELLPEQQGKSIDPEILKKLSDEAFINFLKTMPKNYYAVFNLHVIDGFSHKEIGTLINISEDLSRKRLSRARSWLVKRVQNRETENFGFNK